MPRSGTSLSGILACQQFVWKNYKNQPPIIPVATALQHSTCESDKNMPASEAKSATEDKIIGKT
jgi:nitrate reductase cytochrome c-type subunit